MTDFGAFIELEPGIDALLHVSQISKSHVDKPSDVLKIGQEIEAKVVDFNPDERKISLSMKAIEQDAAEEKDAETVFEDVAKPEAAPAVEEDESVAEEAAPAEEEAAPTEEKAEPAAEETAQDAAAAEE